MISRKSRPVDGPAANHLRGGPRIYSDKTALGGWIENAGGPAGYKRGFTTEEYITTAQQQQLGDKKVPEFGAALPIVDHVERPMQTSDLFHPKNGPTTKDWKSSTQFAQEKVFEKGINDLPVDMEKLRAYRNEWTIDSVEGRKLRFDPESRKASNVSVKEDFKVHSIRMLPGVPFTFERLLQCLQTRYGIFAIAALRGEINCRDENLRSGDLKQILSNLSVQLSKVEFSQMIAYLTAGDIFSGSKLLSLLTPRNTQEFSVNVVNDIFTQLFTSESLVPADTVGANFNSVKYPEVADGLSYFLSVYYQANTAQLSVNDFIQLHEDFYHSQPYLYKNIVNNMWNTGGSGN